MLSYWHIFFCRVVHCAVVAVINVVDNECWMLILTFTCFFVTFTLLLSMLLMLQPANHVPEGKVHQAIGVERAWYYRVQGSLRGIPPTKSPPHRHTDSACIILCNCILVPNFRSLLPCVEYCQVSRRTFLVKRYFLWRWTRALPPLHSILIQFHEV